MSAVRNTLVVMLGTLGSRLLGLLRQLIINRFDTHVTDAFNIASSIPNLFRELLAEGALVNSFIPVYKGLDEAEKRRFASAFMGALLGVNLVLLALGVWAAPWLVQLFVVVNSTTVDLSLATTMTRLMMPFLMLISLSAVAMGLLNADEHFRESSFAPIAFNIVSIVMLLALPDTAFWLAISWTVGGLAQFLVQLPALRRYGLLPTPRLGWHPKLGRVLALMAPFALTTGSRQFLNLFVRRLLSTFPQGTLTGYSNAETVFQMIMGLFVVSPALALYPRLSALGNERDWPGFRDLTLRALRTITFVAAPMSALLVVLAPYAISVFSLSDTNTGKFEAGSAILTTWALAIVPWGINTFLLRTFYARQETRWPVVVSATSFLCEVGLYYVLTPRLGLYGFGVASSTMGVVTLVVLTSLYHRALGFPFAALGQHLARVVPMAAVAGAAALLVTRVLPAPGSPLAGVLGGALGGGVGLAVYLALAVALRVGEVDTLVKRFRR